MRRDTRDEVVTRGVERSAWRIDPDRSRVEFQVGHLYGLMTVRGRFSVYSGTLDLSADPAVELTIDANSLDTKNRRRDQHLRSADFFDTAHHPEVRFLSSRATLDGERLMVAGRLHAAGRSIPLDIDATLRRVDGELEVDARTNADHRQLGMTWSPLGSVRRPSKLIVHGRLVRPREPAARVDGSRRARDHTNRVMTRHPVR
jgi:polyisoprenoid-binding protein YceI